MKVEGCVALVTGANRGLGKAFCDALIAAGAAKVYAAARDPASVKDPRLTPVRLDVTSAADIAAAAKACPDVTLLINNAGVLLSSPIMAADAEAAIRNEMEVNVFGLMNVSRAFAPVLKVNGGGALVNMLSVASWFIAPFNATYGASKHAALGVSEGLRIELKSQGTQVMSVHAGFVDTEMAAAYDVPKTSPAQVAEKMIEGLRAEQPFVLADARAEEVWRNTRADPMIMSRQMQARWEAMGR